MDKNTEIKGVTIAFVCTKCNRAKSVGFVGSSFTLGCLSDKVSKHKCYKCDASLDITRIQFEPVGGLSQ